VDHLVALVHQAWKENRPRLRIHALTDGRDVGARSTLDYLEPLEALLERIPLDYALATGGGRMGITMDRYEADWDMVRRGWALHVHGQGRRFDSATEAVRTLYAEDPGVDDQWLPPFVVGDYDGMEDGDSVVLFNFRGDRAIEISRAFEDEAFEAFDRTPRPQVKFAGMMQYDGDALVPRHFLVEPPAIDSTVAEHLSVAGLKSLAASETHKFGHVTYFFNGNRSGVPPGEDQVEVSSLPAPADQAPAMRADGVAQVICDALARGEHDHVRLNLANGDMVGHTGSLTAAIEAVEHVDQALARIVEATRQAGGVLLVTADHGNCEEMFLLDKKTGQPQLGADGQKQPCTSHTLNPVPLILYDPHAEWTLREGERSSDPVGGIAQLGATILQLCGVEPPAEYLTSLVQRRSAP
jgi:2,3-bisphosphoglycerate-independent phosphoglycerate mutase